MDGYEFLRQPSVPVEATPEPVPVESSTTSEALVEPQANPYSFGDDYKAPESFESPENELQWYKEKFDKIYGSITSPEFFEKTFEQYKDLILQQEEEAEKIKHTYQALKNNPKDYIRQYYPETLAEIGVAPVLSDDDIAKSVDAELRQKFGDDYQDLYNEKDLAPFKGNTLSRQIRTHGDALYQQYAEKNEQNKKLFDEYQAKLAQSPQAAKPITDEEVQKYLDAQYEEVKDFGLSKDDYGQFIESLKTYNPNVRDFYRMQNFDKLIEDAKKAGIEEGKKSIAANISRASQKGANDTKTVTSTKSNDAPVDFYNRQLQKGNLLPF